MNCRRCTPRRTARICSGMIRDQPVTRRLWCLTSKAFKNNSRTRSEAPSLKWYELELTLFPADAYSDAEEQTRARYSDQR
jgi:hypothetical protein